MTDSVAIKCKNQKNLKVGMRVKVGEHYGEVVERCAGHVLVSLSGFSRGHDACGKYGTEYPPKSMLYVSDTAVQKIERKTGR